MLTRIALYSTLGFLLDAVGHSVGTWQFWSFVGLFWASEHLTRTDLIEEINKEVERIRAERNSKEKQ